MIRFLSEDALYLARAEESLESAISDLADRRYNSCANRCYYACFQAAVAALLRAGIRPSGARHDWPHPFVQSQFNGQLVNRRHLYPSELRTVLPELQGLRHSADYDSDPVTETEATRALRRARSHPNEMRCQAMTSEHALLADPRIRAAIDELQGLIAERFPEATFSVGVGDDPEGVYLRPVVDVEDRGEVVDVFIDRLVDLQAEDALPFYVVPSRPPERNAAILQARANRTAAAS